MNQVVRILAAARLSAWQLDAALAEARDSARSLFYLLALYLREDQTFRLDPDRYVHLERLLARPLAFNTELVGDGAGSTRPTPEAIRLGIAREIGRVIDLDRALGFIDRLGERSRKPSVRRQAGHLRRCLRRARSRSLRLDRSLRRLADAIGGAQPTVATGELELLSLMSRLLPIDHRSRFIEEHAAELVFANGLERVVHAAGLLAGMPCYAWMVHHERLRQLSRR
jgi:hypothetical protein